jgi:hypothetical protein
MLVAGLLFAPHAAAAPLLSWAPPAGYGDYPVRQVTASTSLTDINARGGDVRIVLPSDRSVGPIVLQDCRNAVLIGGSIKVLPSATVGGYDQRALYVRNCTGTVHIEGLRIDGNVAGSQSDGIAVNAPQATVQIQNVRVDGLRGGESGNHADVFQPWGGVREYRIDRLTGSSNYQGLNIKPASNTIGRGTIRNTNLFSSGVTPTNGGGYFFWMVCNNHPVTLEGVYVKPRTGRVFGQSVWPGITHSLCPATITNGVASWPKVTTMTGGVREGAPSGGDFVPAGSVGLHYVSPGYRS